jgi:AbiTii
MWKRLSTFVEILAFVAFVILAVRWAWTQSGWFEPYTVLCALVGVGLELCRRLVPESEVATEGMQPPRDAASSLLAWLTTHVPSRPLSETLPVALRMAQKLGDKDLERWILCELNGYSPQTMRGTDVVPEYRTITGRHLDIYGRPLMLQGASAT